MKSIRCDACTLKFKLNPKRMKSADVAGNVRPVASCPRCGARVVVSQENVRK